MMASLFCRALWRDRHKEPEDCYDCSGGKKIRR